MIKKKKTNIAQEFPQEKTRKKGDKELRRIKASENYEVDVGYLKNNEANERGVNMNQIALSPQPRTKVLYYNKRL